MLQTLLNKVNIEAIEFGFDVYNEDGSYFGGHSRTLLNLNDDKYDIHGIFISDPTWDANKNEDELKYSLLPISSMRDSIYQNCDITLLFDLRNDDEFDANLQTLYMKTKYENIYNYLLKIIYSIDRNKCLSLSKIKDETQFYLELKNYIFSKNNNLKDESEIYKDKR